MNLGKIKKLFRRKPTPPQGYEPVAIKEMEFKQGKLTLALAHPGLLYFANEVVNFFNDCGGINYVTTSFWHPEEGPIELIVRKTDRKSPAELHQELLYAVGQKFPGESRHETALRFIREAQNQNNLPAKQSRK